MEKRVLAFDFGASGGRAMAGIYNGEKIVLEELHRFSNDPVTVCGVMYWDVLRLFYEMKQGILKGKQKGGFESIGIDTWGVDFGLLDKCNNKEAMMVYWLCVKEVHKRYIEDDCD